ncbi:hypothetical protein BS50DRAFT_146726 [Corynespora cassiicola Philippines]|uniref:Uncharacterized protein n=1 Tax=Corynespora cassiicola Philippines TaxID=1448308 RepID=A0A2T2N8T6_CORCC|nr:hypothetical protein BS50DRAFT_146726 [Corynespora cassiicola Philippines]
MCCSPTHHSTRQTPTRHTRSWLCATVFFRAPTRSLSIHRTTSSSTRQSPVDAPTDPWFAPASPSGEFAPVPPATAWTLRNQSHQHDRRRLL